MNQTSSSTTPLQNTSFVVNKGNEFYKSYLIIPPNKLNVPVSVLSVFKFPYSIIC